MAEITYLPIDRLREHPLNPRKDLGDLTELADSIRSKGVLQNLTVIPHPTLNNGYYFILIGHRRHAAAELAGLKELPCDPAIIMYWASIKGRHTIITPNGETIRCELDGDLNNSTGVGYVPHCATCPNAAQHPRRK